MPVWFWYTAFTYHYSYSTITAPFPSPFVTTIYKPSFLYFGFLTLPFFALFYSPSSFPSSPPHLPFPYFPLLLHMPIICPYSCTISSYTGFATGDGAYDIMLGLHHNVLTPLRWKDWERFCGSRGQQRKTNEWVLKKKRKAAAGRCVRFMCNTVSTDDSDACNFYYFIYLFFSTKWTSARIHSTSR